MRRAPLRASAIGSRCQNPSWKRSLLSRAMSRTTINASAVIEASTAENTPSKMMDSDPDRMPKRTPAAPMRMVTMIERRRTFYSASAAGIMKLQRLRWAALLRNLERGQSATLPLVLERSFGRPACQASWHSLSIPTRTARRYCRPSWSRHRCGSSRSGSG
jgi:hypothetical protein